MRFRPIRVTVPRALWYRIRECFDKDMPQLFDIERIETWPDNVVRLLEDNVSALTGYEAERVRLDALRERDWDAHWREGGNRFYEERTAVIEEAVSLVSACDIESFHCTRLCKDEIEVIIEQGMKLPSPEFLGKRIDARVAAGDLPHTIAERLKARNLSAETNRRSMIWFVSGRSILRSDEGGLYRLFRYWGGESLYGLHERDETISPVLKKIGKPCIIAARLNIATFQPYGISDAICATFVRSKGIKPDRSSSCMEGNMKESVSAERILRAIGFDNSEFEALTQSSNWYMKID